MSKSKISTRHVISQTGGLGSRNIQNINITEHHVDVLKSPSILGRLVAALSMSEDIIKAGTTQTEDDFKAYKIENKLDHNNVIIYRELIHSLAEYHSLVESGYSSVTKEKPRARQTIYTAIHHKYSESLGKLIQENSINPSDTELRLKIVRENSDHLIESCISYIAEICKTSLEAEGICIEDIIVHSRYIAFHAFTECKILEKP